MSRLAALLRPTFVRHLLVVVVLGLILYGLTNQLSDFRNSEVALAAVSFCAIAGLTVLTGLSGQISLGNGAFMFTGAYTVALLIKHHPATKNKELVLVLLAAVATSAVVGAIVGVAAARLRGPYLAGITLALALGLPVLPKYQHLEGALGGHSGIVAAAPAAPGTIDFEKWQAWICCLAALITLFLLLNLVTSRVGRAFKAVRDDEIAASLAGMSVARIQILAFVVSAASAGLAGGLLALVNNGAGPDQYALQVSLSLLAGAVFGGLGSLAGAAYGAILITFLHGWSTDIANSLSLSDNIANNLPLAIYGATLIIAMLAFPLGLQGLLRQMWRAARSRVGSSTATAR
jgi:branched-chain amino acid transport system permease protein